MLRTLFFIAGGGALGACLRYLIAFYIDKNLQTLRPFPYGIFCVNMLGCLFMGLIAGYILDKSFISTDVRAFIITGFLGALTTFSTFTHDNFLLLQKGDIISFFINAMGQLIIGLLLLSLGYYVSYHFIK